MHCSGSGDGGKTVHRSVRFSIRTLSRLCSGGQYVKLDNASRKLRLPPGDALRCVCDVRSLRSARPRRPGDGGTALGQSVLAGGRRDVDGSWNLGHALYIAMLAFTLPVAVPYHYPTVIWSLLAAIPASAVAVHSQPRADEHAAAGRGQPHHGRGNRGPCTISAWRPCACRR
jgi:signaling repeat-containing protein